MPADAHHKGVLIESAQTELDRAHRAAMNMDGAEMRRGLQVALTALQDAGEHSLAARVETALADLDNGALSEMALIIEGVRTDLAVI